MSNPLRPAVGHSMLYNKDRETRSYSEPCYSIPMHWNIYYFRDRFVDFSSAKAEAWSGRPAPSGPLVEDRF